MNARLTSLLDALRTAALRRGVAWAFLLAISAAYASAVIAPRSLELLCSGNGAMKLLTASANGGEAPQEASSDPMHCGLCAPMAAPPPNERTAAFDRIHNCTPQPSAYTACATLTRPPLPARGPPALS
jgi:hypothetical protein